MRTIRSAPLRSSLARARSTPPSPCSAAKPTIVWPSPGVAASPARMSSVGSRRSSSEPSRGELAGGDLGGPEVGRRGGHQPARGCRRTPPGPPRPARRRSRRRCGARPAGSGRATLAAISVTSAPRRAAAAARARPMRPLERLPRKRTGSIGSRVPPAVTRTRSPSQGRVARRQHRFDPRQQPGRVGQAAACRARRARRARPPRARSRSTPRSRSVARLAWVAASAYMRSFIAGATRRGAAQARKEVVSIESASAGGELRQRVGRGRARPGRRRSWRPARGGRSGRARAAGRRERRRAAGRARTRRSSTGAPTIPSKEAAPTKRVGALGHQHPHAMAGDRRQPGQLQRLVGGDPAAYAEQDSGHRLPPGVRRAGARLGAVLVFELALGKLFERDREVVPRRRVSTIGGGYSPKLPSPRLWK